MSDSDSSAADRSGGAGGSPDPSPKSTPPRRLSLLEAVGPGILVAATGVGAGDLAGGALAGSRLGVAILWVVIVGAALKYVLCEGLARWQLQTGTSLPDGVFGASRPVIRYMFLTYVAVWSFCIGGMLMSAVGECAQAILPIGQASTGRIVHGCLHSVAAITLVVAGGFRLFERMMAVCIAVMFATVVFVAVLSAPDWLEVGRGLIVPSIPDPGAKGVAWTLTLMAGVGGTLTMLCYGTWIREKGRTDVASLQLCRMDLGAGYMMTAVFGIGMVILGSRIPVNPDLKGANLITDLATDMENTMGRLGPAAGWMFRIGAWGAVFSSLLGVWQSVPALIGEMLPEREPTAEKKRYRLLLISMGTVPALCLPFSLAAIQKTAGVTGAAFLPMFALALLLLPQSPRGRDAGFRNGVISTTILVVCLLLFGYLACGKIAATVGFGN